MISYELTKKYLDYMHIDDECNYYLDPNAPQEANDAYKEVKQLEKEARERGARV
jgi:hypothetical protein